MNLSCVWVDKQREKKIKNNKSIVRKRKIHNKNRNKLNQKFEKKFVPPY